ncbi:unnamed protein product, partial [Discosporangium mesarthrocarpum]
QYFRWQWLKFLRLLGSQEAKDAISSELQTMAEIQLGQGGEVGNMAAGLGKGTPTGLQGEVGVDTGAGEGADVGAGADGAAQEDGGWEGGLSGLSRRICEAAEIKGLLEQNTEELDSLLKALDGSYVLPGVGGDLLRDGAGVLPTGRNMHALDPYRMPSPAAWARGQEAARKILEAHVVSTGAYPETVAVSERFPCPFRSLHTRFIDCVCVRLFFVSAQTQRHLPPPRPFPSPPQVMMWGLDAIKTRGESVAIALALVGARPVKEATGRVVKYELVPLRELNRPRVDVLASLSGIFRDSFANVVDLLDDLFEEAAAASEEPVEMNFIRKHTLELKEKGVERPAARLFSNPAGDFGSMVNERVGTGDWEDGEALGQTWRSRNSFSYGKGGERGQARPEVLQGLLESTERIVQEIDSVEYGLTDIQEYYSNTGALKRAAETAQQTAETSGTRATRRPVGVSVVEAYGKEVQPRELEATLRMEYRTKLLNPKWAEAMSKQGSGGAYEISQRMTAMIGWSGTSGFAEEWVYDGAAETYALDEEMAAKLRKANPEAFQNILKRMLEANGRGFWDPDDDVSTR